MTKYRVVCNKCRHIHTSDFASGTIDCHKCGAMISYDFERLGDIKAGIGQVLEAVAEERRHQDTKHGPIESHGHTLGEWILIMESELAEAKEALIKGGTGRNAVKAEIIQVIATGFACLEQHGLEPIEKRAI